MSKGWKSVRGDVESVVDEMQKTKRVTPALKSQYRKTLKKILIIIVTSAAAAALIAAGFKRHPELSSKFWKVADAPGISIETKHMKNVVETSLGTTANIPVETKHMKNVMETSLGTTSNTFTSIPPNRQKPSVAAVDMNIPLPFSRHHRNVHNTSKKFTKERLDTLREKRNSILKAVRTGDINANMGRTFLWRSFSSSDPPNVRETLIKDYGVKANSFNGVPRMHTRNKLTNKNLNKKYFGTTSS